MPEDCCKVVDHKRVKVEENGKVVYFLNPDQKSYEKCRIDGCLVTSGPRADALVSEVGAISALIELKGTDVAHACIQLFASAEHPAVTERLAPAIGFLIVCRRYPKFDGFIAKAKQRSATLYKAGFHVVSSPKDLMIDRVAAIDGPY
jgi:hypothetical protein